MKEIVFGALGLLLLCFAFAWAITRIHYHITPRHVRITLFGFVLRRVPLGNIDTVSKRRVDGLAENWWCTFQTSHRLLVIRRKRGLIRNVVITPRNRYAFKSELERAIEKLAAPAPAPAEPVEEFVD
jgi:hypothetical protein